MHRHAFFHTARTTQVALTCGADIEHLADLDRTYWAILSRPTYIEGRAETLASDLDTNEDGRIRMPEVLAAIEWLKPRIASFDRLFLPCEGLVKEDFRDDTPEGKALSALLAKVAPDNKPVTTKAIWDYHSKFFFIDVDIDGDVSIRVDALDSHLERYAELVWKVVGPANRTLAEEHLPLFYDLLNQWKQWQANKPKGRFTLEEVQSRWPLRKKIDDYFKLCDERSYDVATPLGHDPSKPLKDAPISLAGDATQLSLTEGVNPEWANQTAELAKILGTTTLTRDLWESLKREWDPYDIWWKEVPKELYNFLPFTEADFALVEDPTQRLALEAVLQKAKAEAPLLDVIDELKRFAALRGGLLRFLRNFVNVSDLYPPVADPLFLCGKLFMDGRIASLCFPVANGGEKAHAALAAPARCCLVYCTLERKEQTNRTILAVFTAGTVGALTVGKRGLFVDLNGQDWEATVSHVAITTISLWEAFFAPWRKIGEVCSETVQKLIGGRGDTATAVVTAAAVTKTQAAAGTPATTPAAPAVKATPPASNASQMASVATLGISLSFLASAAAAIASAVTHAPLWKTGSVVLGIILVVSIPSVILAWIRLRNRDLAPILNASGWAVNRAIGLTPRLGRFFTQRANYLGRRFVRRPNARKQGV